MPLARIGSKLIYFAHIPKCAGSSVEDYLEERFGLLAFLDRTHLDAAASTQWSRSSPQHVDWASLNKMIPRDFIDEAFAVIRHPLSRAVSAYRFQAEVEGTIAEGMGFGDWLRAEAAKRDMDPFRNDNHLRPQVEFLPPEGSGLPCAVFHMEHGLDALVPYLDHLDGQARGPRGLRFSNTAGHNTAAKGAWNVGHVKPDAQERALVMRLYSQDFEQLGYQIDDPAPLTPAPSLSPEDVVAAATYRTKAAHPLNRVARGMRRRLRALKR